MWTMLAGVPGKLKVLADRLTSTRASNLDRLDANISTRAPASTALSNAVWTDARAGKLDTLSAHTAIEIPLVFTSSTTFTIPEACRVRIVAIGGGGSGGSVTTSSTSWSLRSGVTGGGSGAVCFKTATLAAGTVLSITVGAGGAYARSVPSGPNGINGNNGGTTTVTGGGLSLTAPGGGGGRYVLGGTQGNTLAGGAAAATATGGDANRPGNAAISAILNATTTTYFFYGGGAATPIVINLPALSVNMTSLSSPHIVGQNIMGLDNASAPSYGNFGGGGFALPLFGYIPEQVGQSGKIFGGSNANFSSSTSTSGSSTPGSYGSGSGGAAHRYNQNGWACDSGVGGHGAVFLTMII